MYGKEEPAFLSQTQAVGKQEIFEHAQRSGDPRVLVLNATGDEVEDRTFGAARTLQYR
jgi:hypothetical protein